jgi:hypothetical protein
MGWMTGYIEDNGRNVTVTWGDSATFDHYPSGTDYWPHENHNGWEE